MKKENNYYLRNMTLFEKEKEERKIKIFQILLTLKSLACDFSLCF